MKSVLSIAALLLLLTHPALALEGASRGLLLWSQTVLPTLLPFMICSNAIVAAGAVPLLMIPFRPVFRKLMGLSDAGGYVLLSGMLCGYPMGAKTCREFLSQGILTQAEARRLLAISNHSSPMFLLGYVASSLSPDVSIRSVMAALYLPILPLSFLARRIYDPAPDRLYGSDPDPTRSPASRPTASRPNAVIDFDTILMRSIEVMVRIGGYLMLFSILAAFIERMHGVSPTARALLLGFAEITTGIRSISQTMTGPAQGLCITAATAFGGLSGIFQTRSVITETAFADGDRLPARSDDPSIRSGSPFDRSGNLSNRSDDLSNRSDDLNVTKNAGLSIRHYILWKLLHTAVSCLFFILLTDAHLPGR